MKVILNQDVNHLGEEGDVKDVANGYARNYLFPRNYAVPCNDMTLAYFESKKAEIEARKEAKRTDAASLKERLEAAVITLVMPAGNNGKLYGAVTSQTISDELGKLGFSIERKKIEIPGLTLKNTGKYHVSVHLYESTAATVQIVVNSQAEVEKADQPKITNHHSSKKESNEPKVAAEPSPDADDNPGAENDSTKDNQEQ